MDSRNETLLAFRYGRRNNLFRRARPVRQAFGKGDDPEDDDVLPGGEYA